MGLVCYNSCFRQPAHARAYAAEGMRTRLGSWLSKRLDLAGIHLLRV